MKVRGVSWDSQMSHHDADRTAISLIAVFFQSLVSLQKLIFVVLRQQGKNGKGARKETEGKSGSVHRRRKI